MKHRICSFCAMLLAAALFSGCTSEVQQTMQIDPTDIAAEAPDDRFGLAYQADAGLDPYDCVSTSNRVIFSLIYESLFIITREFEAQSLLAEAYEVTPDGKTTTVTLRPDVLFHDGTPMTATDVAWSLEQAMDSEYYGDRLSHITGIDITDGIVTLTTDTPYECLPLLLDIPISKQANKPVGTGPYQYHSPVRLSRFDDWWCDETPVIDKRQICLISKESFVLIRDAFQFGEIDFVCADPNHASAAKFHGDYALWSVATTTMQYIGFNLHSPIMKDGTLRAALTYAVNRTDIAAQELGGFAQAAVLPISPSSALYDGGLSSDYDYDPDAFRVVISAYGGHSGATMIVPAENIQRSDTAKRIAKDLSDLGFPVTVRVLDTSDYKNALAAGSYDLYYGEARLSPNFDLSSFFVSNGSLAYGGLASNTVETLCRLTLANRGNAYDLYQKIMSEGLLCPVVFKTNAAYATRGKISSLAPCLDRALWR